jgi:uncharacterized protein YuzE
MNDQLSLLYDREADVLYVAKGHPKYTDYVELNNHIILRLDPTTQEIVGFTIIDFAGRFASKTPPLNIPLDATFELASKRRKFKVAMEAKMTYKVKHKKSVTKKVRA